MAIYPPEQHIWWREPIARTQLVWIVVAFIWGLVMFFMMIWWHAAGKQNLSNEAYRTTPEAFLKKATEVADQYTVREENGMPVVRSPPGSDVYRGRAGRTA